MSSQPPNSVQPSDVLEHAILLAGRFSESPAAADFQQVAHELIGFAGSNYSLLQQTRAMAVQQGTQLANFVRVLPLLVRACAMAVPISADDDERLKAIALDATVYALDVQRGQGNEAGLTALLGYAASDLRAAKAFIPDGVVSTPDPTELRQLAEQLLDQAADFLGSADSD